MVDYTHVTSHVLRPEFESAFCFAAMTCPFHFCCISAAASVNTNKLQGTTRMLVHLIKISEKLLWTASAASVLLRGLLRPYLSVYLLLWQTRADYYPGCTGDNSHYCNFLFRLQLATCPLCYSQNTCAERLRLWQRKIRKLIFIKRNSFRLITRKKLAACNKTEDTKSHE